MTAIALRPLTFRRYGSTLVILGAFALTGVLLFVVVGVIRNEPYYLGLFDGYSQTLAEYLGLLAVVVACFRLAYFARTKPHIRLFNPKEGEVGGAGVSMLYDGAKAGAQVYLGISGLRFMASGYFSPLSAFDFDILYPLFGFLILVGGRALGRQLTDLVPQGTPTSGANPAIDKRAEESAIQKARPLSPTDAPYPSSESGLPPSGGLASGQSSSASGERSDRARVPQFPPIRSSEPGDPGPAIPGAAPSPETTRPDPETSPQP